MSRPSVSWQVPGRCPVSEVGRRGVRHLMGVDSERVPELAGVREFKNKFVTDGPVDVPGAWDLPVRPRVYACLVRALRLKHGGARVLEALRSRRRRGE